MMKNNNTCKKQECKLNDAYADQFKRLLFLIAEKKLCFNCLEPMEQMDKYSWKCKCSPDITHTIG